MLLDVVRSRPGKLAILLGGAIIVAALMVGALSVLVNEVTAGVPSTVIVNGVQNVHAGGDTGSCDTPLEGTCTLGQAINFANAGFADEINFHPTVFSKATPGVIQIDFGDGCLPDIGVEVVIDSTNVGVILDGDAGDDGVATSCDALLSVVAVRNGFDFTLLGGDNFVIRQNSSETARGDGISVGCNGFSLGDVTITGVIFQELQGDDISNPGCVVVTPTATLNPTATLTPTTTPTPTPTVTSTPPVAPATATATSSPAATATTTPDSQSRIGDANCDGIRNAIDAALILQMDAGFLLTFPCQGASGDVNLDGATDAVDAALILQFVAGLLDSLPPP